MELLKVTMNDFGGAPICEHNYPCPICLERPAVYNLSKGYFMPCWGCRKDGWEVRKKEKWSKVLLKKLFG